MSANIMRPQPAMKLHVLFAISFSWAFHEVPPPKYQHYDPLTSELLLCDQCPPGTAVLTHCTADTPTACLPCPDRSFSEHWHWGDSCQYCTTVCKERQLVSQECNSTRDQLCECVPGYHLVVEFCIKHTSCPPGLGVAAPGTPEIDTVCEACPQGLFSSRMSASEPCVPHRNCSELGLKTLRPGTPTQDTLCENEAKGSVLECSHHHTQCHTDVSLCEEAIFQSLASLRLSSVPLERLLESLPGKRVDRKSLERIKKACSPQQQILLLLRLWREQNKDQVKLYGIIQGVNHCERKVSRCAGLKNLTLGDLLTVMNSLPGVRAHEEDIRAVVSSCRSQQYLLQLLHLWKNQNKDLDINKVDDKGQREGPIIKSFYSWTRDNINMLFPVILVLASVDLSCGAMKEVLQSQTPTSYHHLDPTTGQLLTCNRCPPGHHMSAHCTATTQTVCTPCPSSHYTQYWNYLPKCLYCGTFCGEQQVVKEECSVLNDRVCECKEGYYWDADFCIRHKECPSGYGVKRRGTTETDTECEKCPHGSFSYNSSSRAQCVNHTDCASLGLKTVLRGTCWHDNLCALSCEQLKGGGEFKLLRSFLPDFFSHHKMRVVKLRKLVWRLMASEEEQESQEHQRHPPSSLSVSAQRGLLQGQVKDWIRDASEEDLRSLPEILRKTHQSVMAERLERKMRGLQEASDCNWVRNGLTSPPHCDVEEVSQSE